MKFIRILTGLPGNQEYQGNFNFNLGKKTDFSKNRENQGSF